MDGGRAGLASRRPFPWNGQDRTCRIWLKARSFSTTTRHSHVCVHRGYGENPYAAPPAAGVSIR